MGGSESTRRKVSFGLDEEEKVTVIQGVKGSFSSGCEIRREQTASIHRHPSLAATNLHQAQVQEQLFRLAQREREAAAATAGRKGEAHDDLNPA
ncbi:unnamed protein product, partial [Coregonus sp. 'balchen']